jgi:Putative zinc-finger
MLRTLRRSCRASESAAHAGRTQWLSPRVKWDQSGRRWAHRLSLDRSKGNIPKRCEQIRELLGAYHDQELDSGERCDVAAHLETCANCNATANEIDRIGSWQRRVASRLQEICERV